MAEPEKDALTGTQTTGHEWDGIKELDTPLPKWWLYTFIVCVVWAVGYWVVYPAWPSLSGYTKGVIGYSSRAELDADLAAVKKSRAGWLGKFEDATVDDIAGDRELLNYAMAGGKFIFAENCAPCHGAGGAGAPGYPVLADDDWLWGGTPADIDTTIRFGIRSGHEEERLNEMPRFGPDEVLTAEQIGEAADFVLSLSGQRSGNDAGKVLFEEQCAACHGEDGEGLPEMGGPNLKDGIWLYAGSRDGIVKQIATPRHGVMPAWEGRLDGVSIKQVALYVHSLGGGQ